ncbi:MAG: OmpA family protein [Bacteroidales bacterium]|nr:OmpA family protein [Bacteroidales bacterium]
MTVFKYLIVVALLFLSFSLSAQTGQLKKGDKFYKIYSYSESIEKFEDLPYKTFEINKKLAESYYKTGDYFNAEFYYSEIVDSPKSTSEDIYNYASVLAINQKYTEAEEWMEKFYKLEKGDSRAKLYFENKGFYNLLLTDKEQFRVKNLDINTEQQDFGTAFYNDKIVFASTRKGTRLIKRIWNWNKLSFLDLFIADVEHSQLKNVKPLKKTFNKKYHEGPASYSKDGSFTAFTRNNYGGKSNDGIIKLQIFTSEKENDNWKEAIPFNYNNDNYSVGHPALTADGKTMYFASDMPGGHGGVDIYVSKRNKLGEWSAPKNLGRTINTEGNEMFPFIHKDGFLFFASDGLLGLGGLDIYFSKIKENGFTKPKNVGVPVNSNFDDFALIIDKKMRKGYFSSNRTEGKGDDDIYSFRLLKPFTIDVIIKGTVKDDSGNTLANTDVSLYNNQGEIIKIIASDKNGNYEFTVSPDSEYKLQGSKPKHITAFANISTKTEDEFVYKNLTLERLPDFTLLCNVTDKENNVPVAGVKVSYINNKTGERNISKTYDNGEFFIKLNEYKLNDSVNYTFTFEKDGFAPKITTYNGILNRMGEYSFNINLQKIKIGENLGQILEINPIYFDFNKYNIRPDAANELDKIVKIMNEYPKMEIELSSHTDCRGSSIYNLKLSDKRAKASAHYIKVRITNPTRISGQGYGENKLINKCGCEGGQKVECTEAQHQQNRRTEFKIIRM